MQTSSLTDRLQPYVPTALRVSLGLIFLVHVYMKIFVFTVPGTMAFFEAHGFPAWSVYVVIPAELFGGLALIAGYRVRAVALGLVPVMLGAIKPHLANGPAFDNAGGGWEMPALLVVLLGAQAVLGAGAYALDRVRAGVITARAGRNPVRASVITSA